MGDQFPGVVIWLKLTDANIIENIFNSICSEAEVSFQWLKSIDNERFYFSLLGRDIEVSIAQRLDHWRFEVVEEGMLYDEEFKLKLGQYVTCQFKQHNVLYGVGLDPNTCKWMRINRTPNQ